MSKFFRNLLIIIAIFLIVAGAFTFFNTEDTQENSVSVTQVATEINEGKVDHIEIAGDKLTIFLKDNSQQVSQKENGISIFTTLKDAGADPLKRRRVPS